MFKETFPPIETPKSSEEKEKPQVFYEEQLDNLEKLKQEELKALIESEKEIAVQEDPAKRTKRASKLTAYLLTTFIAFGLAQETLQNQALAQGFPEKKIEEVLKKIDVNKLEQERLKDYQELKKIIEEEKIEEKVKFLKEQYGSAIEHFLSIHKINETLHFLKMVKIGLEQKKS